MPKPIVWTIAGSDSGGGAGIQADLHTFHALGTHGCSVITALTAQNSQRVSQVEFTSSDMVTAQIEALEADLPPRAIKLGMLGSLSALQAIVPMLKKSSGPVIYDPVLFASAGETLHKGEIRHYLIQHFLPHVTLLTPNLPETEWLLGHPVVTNADMERAADELLKLGPKAILIKGGHATAQEDFCQDYWTDGQKKIWLTSKRSATPHRHGSGCTLASAITACLARDYSLSDALVIAKSYVNQSLRLASPLGAGPGPLTHASWPECQEDLPWLGIHHADQQKRIAFPACGPDALGFYPIVDSAQWVKRCLIQGVKTLQLRVKNATQKILEEELKTSITLARDYNARLFINDYWELALKLGAYGVHLGQEDLDQADIDALRTAGLRLGISTHSYTEVARAHALAPSYIAVGPIFPTASKPMAFQPQGLEQLRYYCRMLDYPLIGIGGINWERLPDVQKTGVNGVAVIAAITQAEDPDAEIKKWVHFFKLDAGKS